MNYSVLLLYPDYMQNDGTGHETFYAFVKAPNVKAAVKAARKQAMDHNKLDDGIYAAYDPMDFATLLVLPGHVSGYDTGGL